MTTVTVYTAERMQEIEDQAVIGASIVDGHVIFERYNGTTFDGGAIDVTVLGNLVLSIDEGTYYRYTDAASPLALTADIYTPMSETIMDTEDAPPEWAHWDDTTDELIIDEAGFYDIFTYVTIDSSADGTGHSVIKVTGIAGGGENEFDHVSGTDVRLETQYTGMYDVGQTVRVDVKSSGSLNVTYAEIYVRKFNITMDGGAEGGGSAGQTPWASDIDAAGYALQDVGAIESSVDTVGTTGATQILDTAVYSSFDMTMDMNCAFSFSNPAPAGKDTTFSVILRGAFAPTWPVAVIWPDGSEPTYASPSIYVFKTVNNGSVWFGMLSGGGFS